MDSCSPVPAKDTAMDHLLYTDASVAATNRQSHIRIKSHNYINLFSVGLMSHN
jgi:sulfur relay (sulfurtransferase) DsrF/TusC family protein